MPVEKLIILYLLDKLNFGISDQQLIEIVIRQNLMSYFDLTTSIADLIQGGMVKCNEATMRKLYLITEKGKTTLKFFEKELLLSKRTLIDEFCNTNKSDLQLEASLFSDYVYLGNGEYRVILMIFEKSSAIFELSFRVFSKEDAKKAISKWKTNAKEIYKNIFNTLLQ
ncbi:MAG: DUF4364 family protein [Eubacteriales bacterium]